MPSLYAPFPLSLAHFVFHLTISCLQCLFIRLGNSKAAAQVAVDFLNSVLVTVIIIVTCVRGNCMCVLLAY